MKLLIELESVQKVFDYLMTRPFGEVVAIVPLLQNLQQANVVTAAQQDNDPASVVSKDTEESAAGN